MHKLLLLLKEYGDPPIIFQICSFFNITNQLVTFDKNLTGMTSVKLWNYFRITSRFFPFVIPRPFLILPFHSPKRTKKNLKFCLSFGKQLSHFLARGYFLLVLVNDFVRRWLAGTFAYCTNELKKLLAQRKSRTTGREVFQGLCRMPHLFVFVTASRNILFRTLKWLHFSPTGGLHF